MVHIENEVTQMLDEWGQKGFKGVRFVECYLEGQELSDWLDDGKSITEFEEFTQDYACFVAHPDLYNYHQPKNRYESIQVNWHAFDEDLQAEIRRRLGSDIQITHYSGCHEYEVQRIKVEG